VLLKKKTLRKAGWSSYFLTIYDKGKKEDLKPSKLNNMIESLELEQIFHFFKQKTSHICKVSLFNFKNFFSQTIVICSYPLK